MADSKLELTPDEDVVHGTPQRLTAEIERVVCNNPTAFTHRGTNTYLIDTGKGVIIVDPGPDDAAHGQAILNALNGREASHILVTHTHKDHSPLSRRSKAETGAEIWGCAAYQRSKGATPGNPIESANDKLFQADRVMADGDTLTHGSMAITAVTTPGHAGNHLAFSINDAILLSGDHVMGWSTTVVAPPDGNMTAYYASLEKLFDRPETLYLSGHGAPITKPQRLVRGLLTHRKQRENQLVGLLDKSAMTITELVPIMYPTLAPTLYMAAGLSVFAHIENLIERQLVTELDAGDDRTIGATGDLASDMARRFKLA